MKKIIFIYLFFISLFSFSQNNETDQILSEGKLLYRLEKGSWYSTDHFLENYKNKRDSIGGYLSYKKNNLIYSIFFSRFNPDIVLARYTFDSIPKQKPIEVDIINKNATKLEQNLIKIRQDARDRASENSDGFFKFYNNTALNFIPLISKNKKQVFILTGPQVNGIVLLGNDYLLDYNKKNKFKKKNKLHNSILEFSFKSENKDNPTVSTIHSHTITKHITSTDICTLLLYKDYIEWKQHIVISDKEVSIFNLENENLFVMKRKAWEKINEFKKKSKD